MELSKAVVNLDPVNFFIISGVMKNNFLKFIKRIKIKYNR
jgi:hypothetical protein